VTVLETRTPNQSAIVTETRMASRDVSPTETHTAKSDEMANVWRMMTVTEAT
jgi:hypothetical protein